MSKVVRGERTETIYDYDYICDSCQAKIEDTQETLHWRMTGGYFSIFGDGVQMELDLCQECIKTRLGNWQWKYPEVILKSILDNFSFVPNILTFRENHNGLRN